jgi:hypothetical protein
MNQPVRDKLGVRNVGLEVHQHEQKWLRHLQIENGHKQDTQGGCAV